MLLSDEAIVYQLEKVDQGGEVSDLFEGHMKYLAEVWGAEYTQDGYLQFSDGRRALLIVHAEVIYGEG